VHEPLSAPGASRYDYRRNLASGNTMSNQTSGRVAALGIAVTLVLGGCGFQLRGQAELPENVRTVHVQGPAVFLDEIQVFVESGGAEIVSSAEEADASVEVGGEQFEQRTIAVDPSTGKEREFELVYTVSFKVTRPDGTVALGPEGVRIVRDFLFDSDEVLGRSRERDRLEVEMRRDAAEEVVRRIELRLR
jgi:LPS-assembly lipoprotein